MGHHVGDWEHTTVRFEHNRLHSMYLSIHDSKVTRQFGGSFRWNGKVFHKGNRFLKMEYCTHGVVYSAKGSHGMWPSSGNHIYMRLPNGDTLVDRCSDGTSWQTWRFLKVVMHKPKGQYRGQFTFLNFKGRWGNRKRGCGLVEKVSGECMLNNGPSGP
jgi:hypothetical protein